MDRLTGVYCSIDYRNGKIIITIGLKGIHNTVTQYTQRRSQGAAHGAQAAPKDFVPTKISNRIVL